MSSIALWGFDRTQGPGVICYVFVWILLYLLSARQFVLGRAVPGEVVLNRLVLWEKPHNLAEGLGGRSPYSGRHERGVRVPREEPTNATSETVDIVSTITTFEDLMNITTAEITNSSIVTTVAPPNSSGQGAGTIIGAFFGALLGCAIIGGALYLLIRYKRAQTAEYNRSVQLHMSSTRNAGVYVDLAEPSDIAGQGRDYTSLKQQNNEKAGKKDRLMEPDLYEYDSDDEVCVYK